MQVFQEFGRLLVGTMGNCTQFEDKHSSQWILLYSSVCLISNQKVIMIHRVISMNGVRAIAGDSKNRCMIYSVRHCKGVNIAVLESLEP